MTTFISYSRANSDFAVRLAKDLKAAGYDVWLDQLDIPTGARWDDELEKALRKCSTFLIILSPESIASQNVKDEIGYAIDSGKHILPVMIKQCDVPFRMRRFQYVDFTKDDYDERFTDIKALLSNTAQLPTATEAEKSSSPAKTPVPKVAEPKKPQATATSSSRKLLPWLLGGGAAVIVIIILVVSLSGGSETPAEPAASSPAISNTNTSAPAEPTDAPAEPTTVPEEPASEPQPFFTEEFDGDLSHWSSFVTSGDENRMNVFTEDGKMIFDLGDPNEDLYAYYVLNDFTYTDVQIETVANNLGVNDNNVSLICRYTEKGWYEFNIANNGLYSILAFDTVGAVASGYNIIFSGGSNAINPGHDTNTYVASCSGNKLSLSINGEKVRTINDNQFRFEEGKVGLSVSSFQVLPVKVEFDSFTISEP